MTRILETERLLLRPFRPVDLDSLHEYASDAEVTRYMIWGPNRDRAESARFLKDAIDSFENGPQFSFAVERRMDCRLIGSIGLSITSETHREAEVGYCYRKDAWGQGYATEAARRALEFGFDVLTLHRIFATCRPVNAASAHVLQKIGMKQEGFLRRHRFAKGEWQDSLLFAILQDEWEQARRPSRPA